MIFLALTIWTDISEKIGGLIQSTSGNVLPGFAVYAIGLFVLLAILLMIALAAKKGKWMKKKSAADKIIESQKQKQAPEEASIRMDLKKHTGNETTDEQQIDKSVIKDIHEPMKGTFLSGSSMSSDENPFGHLIKEIQRIDQIIRFNIDKWKKEHSKDENEFPGLCITENELNGILKSSTNELEAGSEKGDIQTISGEIYENHEKEKYPRLYDLQKLFQLYPFEVEILLICLVSELDTRYEKLYSYLQNDITKKRPTVDLVINLLCPSVERKLRAREYFSPQASLFRNGLIFFTGDGQEIPLLSRSIKVDERIVSYLLGSDEIDHRIRNFSSIIEPGRHFDDLILREIEKNALRELIKCRQNIKNPLFFFHGAYGTGKKMTAEVICRELGIHLLVVDLRALIKGGPRETLRIIIREACLQNSSLYLEGFDALLEKEAGVDITAVFQELDLFPNWVFLGGELPYAPPGILKNHSFIEMAFPILSFTFRKKLWKSLLEEDFPEPDIDALASKFNFSGGQIKDAIFTARNLAMAKKPENYKLSLEDLYYGSKAQSNKNLSSFAKNIPPRYTWVDVVLPNDIKKQLKEVSEQIKHKGKVYGEWGFGNKLSLGKGLNVLFSGPSGTGKTMVAEIIAKDAGLDLYKIDLSSVVSKYIGETEKILRKIFNEAETGNAILFFDEADALFGKRSEVRDSHDRYANIEINYLLQKIEEHEGIVILASNFRVNIDEAFMRRMNFAIEFSLPDEEMREKIWRNIFPEKTPVSTLLFHKSDFKDPASMRAKLINKNDPLSAYLEKQLSPYMLELLKKYDSISADVFKENLGRDLNRLISGPSLFDEKRFEEVVLAERTRMLIKQNPEGDERIHLNRLLLEEAYPHEITKGIDFGFLAKFKITGGNIKNIALSAAFLAASEESDIKMEHIIRATKREFQKMGTLFTAEDFGEYYEMVK
ncbi:MAG TPA: ATP-binding protein [Candidatus Limnocylindrales bacterium]|nr:ATP-binding protein [Candidatus Limnocylindrales bacterium]